MKSRLAASTAFVLFLLLELVAHVSAASTMQSDRRVTTRQIGRSGNTVTLEVSIPTPAFDTSASGQITLRPLTEQRVSTDPFAPIVLAVLAERAATTQIVSTDVKEMAVGALAQVRPIGDIADDGKRSPSRALAAHPIAHLGIGYSAIEYRGIMRARGVSSIVLGAYDLAGSHLRYVSRIVLKLTDSKAAFATRSITDLSEPYRASAAEFRSRLALAQPRLARTQSIGDLQQSPGIQSEDGWVYRMNVREDGIYHLGYDDLKKFGLPPGAIDVKTLRIVNRGQQVPVYIFDGQDNHFDIGDYIEFFGEKKQYEGPGTYGDFRYDPDTKDNTYYLVWGTRYSPLPAGGLQRIVEESGEIRTADRAKYTDLVDASFPSVIHFEYNSPGASDNLEISDINGRSDLRDHSFMAILKAGENQKFSTVVPFADVRSTRPLTLRVALHGLSHDDPGATDPKGIALPDIPNEHEVEVAINGHSVLHGIWDSQQMLFLSTDTTSQRIGNPPTVALLGKPINPDGDVDPLDVTVWNRKDPTGLPAYVRFGVNWFDLSYDRLYWAYKDQLTFHAPKYSTAGLYQFTLRGYSRPDISIYRRGISKITNAVYSENPKQAGSAKTVFQINVSSDADEFIAVTEDKKLKPYSYERDDFQKLRDPSNRGEYLIITGADHLAKHNQGAHIPLEDLLKHRIDAQHVTGKIVDVRNIYDEFRFGARSANAIKDFLDYTYHNWQDPPKYVLLVGTTHPGDGDPQPFMPLDQVPAPYIQAFQEGQVAADPWYALLDGDDLIPDIALGRVATGSIDEDAVYVEKAIEYDRDAALPGDWKDKLFFISIGSQFGDQARLMLTNSIPHKVDSKRMETQVRDRYFGTDQTLVENVNAGLSSVIYLGHGGNGVWADPLDTVNRPVFTGADMPRLTNAEKYPIIVSLTCFTAGYDHPETGIINSFLVAKNAGAIAGFGTTAFGWAQNDFLMGSSIMPHIYDSVGGTYAERIMAGKIEYLTRYTPGDLLPVSLTYCYHFLGDPMVEPHRDTDHVSLALDKRSVRSGDPVQISGMTSIATGEARIELVDPYYSPLVPPHVIEHVPVQNGVFAVSDIIPNTSMDVGAYRAIVTSPGSPRYAASTADITVAVNRVTEVTYDPRPLPVATDLRLSATVQAVQAITKVTGEVDIYSTDPAGVVTRQPTLSIPMSLVGDRYVGTILSSRLRAGDRVLSTVRLDLGNTIVYSDTISITVGAAADPAAYKDANHRGLSGKYQVGPNGLVWSGQVYNWGGSESANSVVSLLDLTPPGAVSLGSVGLSSIPPHSFAPIAIPVHPTTLDSALYAVAIAPQPTGASRPLIDSLLSNDTTMPFAAQPAAVAYVRQLGTTLDGATSAAVTFSGGEVQFALPSVAFGNVERSVVRLARSYQRPVTTQPDIHFVPLRSSANAKYATLRVVDDSLGAVPLNPSATGSATLSLSIDPNDSLIRMADSLFVYRLDDRSKLWTKLSTARPSTDRVIATLTNLGTFAVGYHTDTRPPVVDITVEGQVFSNNGEVPPQPHIQCVIQDANGIDVTPGKTIVKIDNRILQPSEYTVLDSGRTTTTVNLRMEPSLSNGSHTISVQATDDNGNTNTPPKELSVHVSNEFAVSTLGSYPNPFTRDYMFIAYEIRGIAYADQVSLDIYTVSGRRIRTLEFPSPDPNKSYGFMKGGTGSPTSLGYHEVWWDGRDDSLDDVANGPYYYLLRVKTRNATREVKGKFARVR